MPFYCIESGSHCWTLSWYLRFNIKLSEISNVSSFRHWQCAQSSGVSVQLDFVQFPEVRLQNTADLLYCTEYQKYMQSLPHFIFSYNKGGCLAIKSMSAFRDMGQMQAHWTSLDGASRMGCAKEHIGGKGSTTNITLWARCWTIQTFKSSNMDHQCFTTFSYILSNVPTFTEMGKGLRWRNPALRHLHHHFHLTFLKVK